MAAAELTPSVVQKHYKWYTGATGTPIRVVEYLVKLTKVTQNDWFVTGTYCESGIPIEYWGNTIDSSNNSVQETLTYTNDGTKMTLASATVGTTYVTLVYGA